MLLIWSTLCGGEDLPRAGKGGARPVAVTLDRIGYPNGLLFESVEERQSVHFPLPRDIRKVSASLRLQLIWSPLLREPSALRVMLNDITIKAIPLKGSAEGPYELLVDVPREALTKPVLKVTIAVSATTSMEVCLDEKLRAGFVQVLPQSVLIVNTEPGTPPTVRSAFDLLPKDVTIAVSSQPLPVALLQAAWQLTEILQRGGHTVQVVRLPEPGNILIATEYEVAAATHSLAGSSEALRVRETDSGPVLTLTEPWTLGTELLDGSWIALAKGDSYSPGAKKPALNAATANGDFTLRLDSLDAGSSLRESPGKAEWSVRIGPGRLPPLYRVQQLILEVVSAPGLKDLPVLLHSYINGNLIQSMRIPDDGQAHQFTIPIPARLQGTGIWDEIRLVTQRVVESGRCTAVAPTLPVQLLPGTAFIARTKESKPASLRDAAALLRAGFRVYIDPDVASSVETLPFLAEVSGRLGLDLSQMEIRVLRQGDPIGSDKPFLILSSSPPQGIKFPVRFDRGRVWVEDAQGQVVLDLNHMPGITVAQLARSAEQTGIWIMPTREGVLPAEFDLGSGDVAFFDETGLVRAFDSRATEIARLKYPDFPDWTDLARRYRLWLFAVAWLAFTVAFVRLYRKVMHRKETV